MCFFNSNVVVVGKTNICTSFSFISPSWLYYKYHSLSKQENSALKICWRLVLLVKKINQESIVTSDWFVIHIIKYIKPYLWYTHFVMFISLPKRQTISVDVNLYVAPIWSKSHHKRSDEFGLPSLAESQIEFKAPSPVSLSSANKDRKRFTYFINKQCYKTISKKIILNHQFCNNGIGFPLTCWLDMVFFCLFFLKNRDKENMSSFLWLIVHEILSF